MSRQRDLTILGAMADPKLFGRWFGGPSWRGWKVFLAALFGLPLTKPQLALYQRHTGRKHGPRAPAREAWLPVGRRGGKSIIAALIAVFLAFFRDYSKYLAPGERATVMVIAADRRQARVVFRYITGLIDHTPMLARMVENRTREAIDLTNRVTIEVHTASFRAIRGYTVAAAICDEIAFWRSEEAANPDVEVLNGLRPGMATIPGALLLGISSPYARRGALWEAHKKHYGKDRDPILFWQADTQAMNPTIDKRTVAEAYEQDPAVAEADYGAKFRRDIEHLFPREAVEAVTVPDRRELPPNHELQYVAFCDPSGGSEDSFTLAIAHLENGRSVLDAIRERRPPFSPEEVVGDFAALLRSYGINRVSGDRYAGEWPRERFRAHGILYQPASKSKSEIYGEFVPLVNSERVELLDHPKLFNQVLGLERRVRHGGHSSIDHEPGGHDDLANVAAGVSVELLAPQEQEIILEYQEPVSITPELDEAEGFLPDW